MPRLLAFESLLKAFSKHVFDCGNLATTTESRRWQRQPKSRCGSGPSATSSRQVMCLTC